MLLRLRVCRRPTIHRFYQLVAFLWNVAPVFLHLREFVFPLAGLVARSFLGGAAFRQPDRVLPE